MSGKSKAAAKSTAGKIVGPFVPEPLPPVTPVPVGTDPATLPFMEWSDQDLNSEKWDLPKAKDTAKQKPPQTLKKTPSSTPAQFPVVNNLDEPLQFVDPHLLHLPHILPVHEWKRPSEVFPGANFIMYKESSEYPDLISGSKHLLHSDFMRSFISAIGILEYLGNTRPSPIEFASPTFFPNTSSEPWRPWHHIYSMCKAGKGQKHNPQVNSLGKYVVRLFWMGSWRKILIDDLLPIDLTKHVLLPTLDIPIMVEPTVTTTPIVSTSKSTIATESKKAKEKEKNASSKGDTSKAGKDAPPQKEIEMWPFLLCKALLKLASLTWTDDNEILDFDIIHCLTGWFVQKIEVSGLDVLDIWDMCAGYSDHYTWPDSTEKRGGTAGSTKKGGKEPTSKESKSSKSTKGDKKVSNFLDDEDSKIIPYHLVAMCTDMRTVVENEVPDVSPCWSHQFLIDQTRNIPLIKPDPLPELARWKRFRWLAWAIRKGFWPAPELVPIKCFKIVSVFKKCSEHIVYTLPSKEAIDIKKSVAVIEELALEMGDGKKKKDGKDKGDKSAKDMSSKSTKSDKSSTKDKKGNTGASAVALPPDPSIWGDFNKLGSYISCLYIFFKSSLFSANIKITDISQVTPGKDAGKAKADKGKKGGKTEATGPTLLMWNNEMLLSRNEPVYLFLDSVDYKLVVINFAQEGNINVLQKPENQAELSCMSEQEFRYSVNEYKPKRSIISCNLLEILDIIPVYKLEHSKPRVPFAYVVIENYNWQTSKVGDMTTFLNTYGTKTMLIDVKPGRFVMRMWIKSDTSYSINLMSDTPLVAGTLEVVLENMSHEPERLLKMCHDISSTYGQLVQKFGTPQFTEGLISFCRSYLPDSELSKLQQSQVHGALIKELLKAIKDNCTVQELGQQIFALKILFMNPDIKLEQFEQRTEIADNNLSEQLNGEEVSLSSEDVHLAKKTDRAAVTLQAFFKKLYVRKLKALHSQTHKDYMKTFDILKKIYTDTFSIYKRMITCPPLIRNFLLSNPDMYNLRDYYSLFNDLNSSIHLQHFTGNVDAPPNTWMPITRHVFYCNSPNSIIVKICLFCGFPKYMVRIFDNDTNKEIKRFTNNATVYAYDNNALGYTVLCYGWSEVEGDISWKLDFVTLKEKTDSLIIVPQVTVHNYTLKQNYRPTVNNIICRCLVNINHDTLVTFRLSASFEDVKLHFRCINEVGQIFDEIYGTECVILPAIMLKYVERIEDSTESISTIAESISSKDRKASKSKLRGASLTRSSTNSSIRKKSKRFDRMSLDKFSITSEKKPRLSRESGDVVKYKDTVYIVEGFVVDDSWPLTKVEWNVVEDVKAKSLLGPPRTDSFDSLSSVTKSKDTLSKRSSDLARSLDKKRQSSEVKPIDNPVWRLETISNIEDSLVATVDKRREEEIKYLKRQWYENDPERYEKSKQLREAYLESHYIKWETTPTSSLDTDKTGSILSSENQREPTDETAILIEDGEVANSSKVFPLEMESGDQNGVIHTLEEERISFISSTEENLRTLKRPVSRTKMLPSLNFENYSRDVIESEPKREKLTKNEEEKVEEGEEEEIEKHIRTFEDEENLKLLRAQAISNFELDQECYKEDMQKYLANQVATNKILDVFYKECRGDSKEMMQEAFDLREKVIDTIIEEEKAKQPPPTESQKGKDKKGKK